VHAGFRAFILGDKVLSGTFYCLTAQSFAHNRPYGEFLPIARFPRDLLGFDINSGTGATLPKFSLNDRILNLANVEFPSTQGPESTQSGH
jgi:hypothetical protein